MTTQREQARNTIAVILDGYLSSVLVEGAAIDIADEILDQKYPDGSPLIAVLAENQEPPENPFHKTGDFGHGKESWNEQPEFQCFQEGQQSMLTPQVKDGVKTVFRKVEI